MGEGSFRARVAHGGGVVLAHRDEVGVARALVGPALELRLDAVVFLQFEQAREQVQLRRAVGGRELRAQALVVLLELLRGDIFAAMVADLPGYAAPLAGTVATLAEVFPEIDSTALVD